ncbi:hypothetical protein [Enterococcus faecalis]|uniref:hypothetical protein n=1 Tax=Enterococcus faecalis TaxID=1351 RepID=UPI002DBED4A1|nr:hypothetical protein [Enterococcus faecalis]MEB7792088.1 hypothetical protein [Enterococcus faecalis]MEB7810076.1 hypothetical protein [Enterococcus faecalis]
MGEKEQVVQLLINPLISSYTIEMMSNGRLFSSNVQRYRIKVKNEADPLKAILPMRPKTIQLFLEIAIEVERVQPKNKKEVKDMVKNYCYGKGELK